MQRQLGRVAARRASTRKALRDKNLLPLAAAPSDRANTQTGAARLLSAPPRLSSLCRRCARFGGRVRVPPIADPHRVSSQDDADFQSCGGHALDRWLAEFDPVTDRLRSPRRKNDRPTAVPPGGNSPPGRRSRRVPGSQPRAAVCGSDLAGECPAFRPPAVAVLADAFRVAVAHPCHASPLGYPSTPCLQPWQATAMCCAPRESCLGPVHDPSGNPTGVETNGDGTFDPTAGDPARTPAAIPSASRPSASTTKPASPTGTIATIGRRSAPG